MQFLNELNHKSNCFFQRKKAFVKICALLVLIAGLLLCLFFGFQYEQKDAYSAKEEMVDFQTVTDKLDYLKISQNDRYSEPTDCKEIHLSDYSNEVIIDQSGNYLLTGDLNGSLLVCADEENVHLFFNGVTINSQIGPAIRCEQTNKLMITLMDESVNYISDSGKYVDELDACIYSECSIVFNGTGSLYVNGYYKDAVKSKDVLKLVDGHYNIKCKRTGLHGNDGVVIDGGEYIISSEKNGVKTSKKGGNGQGSIVVSGGKISVIAGRYSFVATKADLYIFNCSIYDKSIVDTYDVGGEKYVQEGCIW